MRNVRGRASSWHAAFTTAALLGAVVTLSGCSPVVGASPLSDQDRSAIRSAILTSAWRDVSAQYPEAIRPPVSPGATLSDHDWSRELIQCLRDRGIVARLASGAVIYGSSNGQPPLEVAVSFYSCTMAHPSAALVAGHLDDFQSYVLLKYYENSVRECLVAAGAPSSLPRTPSAAQTLAGVPVASSWNPYEVVWASTVSPATLGMLEQRCPPIPAWLNIGSG